MLIGGAACRITKQGSQTQKMEARISPTDWHGILLLAELHWACGMRHSCTRLSSVKREKCTGHSCQGFSMGAKSNFLTDTTIVRRGSPILSQTPTGERGGGGGGGCCRQAIFHAASEKPRSGRTGPGPSAVRHIACMPMHCGWHKLRTSCRARPQNPHKSA